MSETSGGRRRGCHRRRQSGSTPGGRPTHLPGRSGIVVDEHSAGDSRHPSCVPALDYRYGVGTKALYDTDFVLLQRGIFVLRSTCDISGRVDVVSITISPFSSNLKPNLAQKRVNFILSRWKARGSWALVSGLTFASYCSGNGFRATNPQPEPNALMQLLAAINPNPFPRYRSFTSILSRISRSFPRGSQTSCTLSDQSSPSNTSRYGSVSEKLSRTSYHSNPSSMASPSRQRIACTDPTSSSGSSPPMGMIVPDTRTTYELGSPSHVVSDVDRFNPIDMSE